MEVAFNNALSPDAYTEPYQCLIEIEDLKRDRANAVAKEIFEIYAGKQLSITTWNKQPIFQVSWLKGITKHPLAMKSIPMKFKWVSSDLHLKRKFDYSSWNVPAPEQWIRDNWMDYHATVFPPYMPSNQKEEALIFQLPLPYGSEFPISPGIDREGFASANLQPCLD